MSRISGFTAALYSNGSGVTYHVLLRLGYRHSLCLQTLGALQKLLLFLWGVLLFPLPKRVSSGASASAHVATITTAVGRAGELSVVYDVLRALSLLGQRGQLLLHLDLLEVAMLLRVLLLLLQASLGLHGAGLQPLQMHLAVVLHLSLSFLRLQSCFILTLFTSFLSLGSLLSPPTAHQPIATHWSFLPCRQLLAGQWPLEVVLPSPPSSSSAAAAPLPPP
jgi:hypothetical protein